MESDKAMSVKQSGTTASEIQEIVGELAPDAMASILATGATRDEVLEAYAWLCADDSLHRELHHVPHGTVAAVYEILDAEITPPNDR